MLRRPLALAIAFLGCALAGPAEAEPLPDGAFVRANGDRFEVGGLPFRFVGANFEPLHNPRNRGRYKDLIEALSSDGMTVGRMWVLGEGPKDASQWLRDHALFRAGPEGFIEKSYVHLDNVLAAARAAGLRLILTLSNNWPDYGGLPMYLRWAGLPEGELQREAFYTHPQVRAYFRAHLLKLLERKNTVTGVRYVDDPTIFAWELMNESTVLTPAGRTARTAWIGEMARLIKSRDGNHMVAAGLLGYSMRSERAEWVRVHQLPEIDYCDSHLYLQNSESGMSQRRMWDFLDDRAQLARFVVGKPLVIGEFGFRTDGSSSYLGRPRARWFQDLLSRHFGNGGAGALVWVYEPYAGKPRDYGIYIDRDDTRDVRTTLNGFCTRLHSGRGFPQNPRLGAKKKDSLLYTPQVTVRGSAAVHARYLRPRPGEQLLRIPIDGYQLARFERTGVWKGGSIAHAYGSETGEYVYRFAAPAAGSTPPPLPAAVQIEARLSSEWPGAAAPRDGGSEVVVRLDGAVVARLPVIADDGMGRREQILLTEPALLRRLRQGVHTLRFEVPYGPAAHGLCIYGDAVLQKPEDEPPPAGEFTPILVRYLRKPG